MKNNVRYWIVFLTCSLLAIFALYAEIESTVLARSTYEDMIAKASESVVKVEVSFRTTNVTPTIIDDIFTADLAKINRPALPPSTTKSGSIGAGFIVDEKGIIVTNDHVINGGTDITIRLKNNKVYAAHVIATDKDADIAALQIDGPVPAALKPIVFGNSDDLEVGQSVSAIGSPLSLEQTVTRGIVSALNREAPNMNTPFNYFIQTDAAINPGNSGGPLLNDRGQVIGINEFIVSPSHSSIGLGFAITSNFAKFVVAELVNDKKFKRNHVGVNISNVDKTTLEVLGEPVTVSGIYVGGLADNSPNKNILKIGDIITEANGVQITEMRDFIRSITLHSVTDPLNVTVLRNNASLKLQLKVYNQ